MKVLWFSVTPSMYADFNNGHNGGGWISSLERIVHTIPFVELGVAFEYSGGEKSVIDGVSYYPIDVWSSIKQKMEKSFSVKAEEKYLIPACLDVISDFKPDLIQVFGSENCFSLLPLHTSVPVVIHMQGCLSACFNAYFPVGMSSKDILFSSKLNLLKKYFLIKSHNIFGRRAEREMTVLRHCHYFIGRTHWDRTFTRLYNPKSHYYHCDESLREPFYQENEHWHLPTTENMVTIVSVISSPLYKGMDVVLKSARLLKQNSTIPFQWKIFGVKDTDFIESHYHICATEVNVKLEGTVSAEQIKQALIEASFYIHPSYIDNSPNSVCEAQILGVPVIACNVGGLSSLIEDGRTGFLVPANDPYKIADLVIQLYNDPSLLQTISNNAIATARKRHDKAVIRNSLISIYKQVIHNQLTHTNQ